MCLRTHSHGSPLDRAGHVFNLLVQLCLSHMDGILRRHAAGSAAAAAAPVRSKSGVERPDQWPAWRRHRHVHRRVLHRHVHPRVF